MGYLYTEKQYNLSLLIKKFLFDKLLSFIFSKKKKKIIVQNNHDYLLLKKKFNLSKKNLIHITGGSGINIKKFSQIKRKKTKNIVMVSRILKNKGVIEFFKASQLLKLKYPDWKFKMIGSSDYNSPDKISRETIEYYQKKKIIIFEGYKKDISKILSKTEIFCLPSYREGMPKSTLEALAAGVPVVTSDAVGCKESILPKKNGLLCKKKNYKSLANQIEKLITQPEMRKKFSINAKNYAKRNFSISDVSKKIYNVYDELNYE